MTYPEILEHVIELRGKVAGRAIELRPPRDDSSFIILVAKDETGNAFWLRPCTLAEAADWDAARLDRVLLETRSGAVPPDEPAAEA